MSSDKCVVALSEASFIKMSNIILSVKSSENQIKQYFIAVMALKNNGEQFPVDLDAVWPLAYASKQKATDLLLGNGQFFEGEDYILLNQMGKQNEGSGGHNRVVYKISIPCMEYLIARKVRAVFEVYRQVFHKTIDDVVMIPRSELEAIEYGYRKLWERCQRQANVIKRQGNRNAKLLSQMESEKAKRIEKAEAKRIKSYESVERFLDGMGYIPAMARVLFVDIWSLYLAFCENNGLAKAHFKALSNALTNRGIEKGRESRGMYYCLTRQALPYNPSVN